MKAKIIIPLLVILSICSLKAQEAPSQHFRQAFEEISAMVEGKQPLDFEKAVFITENAYRDNSLNYEDFKSALNVHSAIIEQFIKANDKYDWKQFVRGNMGIAPDMEIEAKERYRKALANYAIFTYLTDTLTVKLEGQEFLHLPYTYSNDDPFGTADWKNSQTMNLLETQKGNCYSLVTLFKILSERFKSEANIVTAPQHIYIEHRDPKGSRFNVEVATRSFPDMGSIQTLTYTTREALLNDISMRKLDLKQSVGLNLVYLAKGYEYKNKVKDDEFILACANTALQHDPKNLNALLLKTQVYEQRVMKKQMPSALYEKMLAEFYKLGYRQMPDDMKNIILSKIRGTPSTVKPTDKTPNPFAAIGEQTRYVTLSNGLFEELHTPQKIVRYGQTIFDTEKSKIVKFLDAENSSYQVDPVVFALSVDPLSKSYPWYTPYQFAGNRPIDAIDYDGLEPYKYTKTITDPGRGKMQVTVVHQDIIMLVGNGLTGEYTSTYNSSDKTQIEQALSDEYTGGNFVDKSSGNRPVIFEFDVSILQVDKKDADFYSSNGTLKSSKDREKIIGSKLALEKAKKTHFLAGGVASPVGLVEKTVREIGDRGRNENGLLKVGSDSDAGLNKTLGHEAGHTLLFFFKGFTKTITKRNGEQKTRITNTDHHSLGGIVSSPSPGSLNQTEVDAILQGTPEKKN